jgi:exopolysaccharide biosynthesis polyprenyl glycosylphosphotransferase
MLRDSVFRRSLLAADVGAVTVAFVILLVLGVAPTTIGWVCVVDIPILAVSAKLLGLYDRDESLLHKTTLEEAPALFQVATMCILAAWLAGGGALGGRMSRGDVLLLWATLPLCLVLLRSVARGLSLRLVPTERCLFVGDVEAATRIRAKLEGSGRGMRATIVAHVDLSDIAPWSADARSVSKVDEVRELAQTLDVQRAIVAPRSSDGVEVLDLVRTLKAIGVRVSLLPRMLEVIGSSVEFDDLHGVTVMGVKRFELTRSSAAVKRGFDIACAGLGLLFVLPLLIVAALAVKLDSRGPVFFRQQRVGRYGGRFYILKFRTMVREAEELKDSLRDLNEAQGMFKIAKDPRITRVGRVLRKTAIDELPQLFNVLKGEMSIVGPRPLILEEDSRVEGWHRRRLELTPGITGPWQILGPSRVPLREMVSIDYLYVANWSLWSDTKILLRTIAYVACCRGM